jgi:hypothetical protein
MPRPNMPISALLSQRLAEDARYSRTVVAWSSLVFAILQSICTFFAAVNGLRVGIGVSSLLLAAGTAATIDRIHVDWLRVPMISLAVVGSVLNLVILWQIRRLRRRPEAAWRRVPSSPGRSGSERIQLVLSIVTLILVGLEERQHLIWLHHL